MTSFPHSIAIAGAWGYIGRQFLDAALSLGLRIYALDPSDAPDDVDLSTIVRIEDEEAFYRLDADLFHLALHPEHRGTAFDILLERAATQQLLILNEKPMAQPERPEQCAATLDAVRGTQAVMLFDFLELFDPMVRAISRHLSQFDQVEITDITLYRGKDREDPERSRNYKKMVHIQYQESVHCLAFLLDLLGNVRGSLGGIFADGISITARSQPYAPPNPQDYPYVVDGQCAYEIELGKLHIDGRTDFKAGAEFAKRKIVRGFADGKPFVIEANTQEGKKYLRIDGVDRGFPADDSSYCHAIANLGEWYRTVDHRELMRGVYPNSHFARLTYQLSSVLWKSCDIGQTIALPSAAELIAFDAGFAPECFPRYQPTN
ncbi:MAG: hypothetical protein HOC74_14415 [Gemmatimonadetes bacterium]|nr:hypothetical protein [Gemmatimonadota bacterium]